MSEIKKIKNMVERVLKDNPQARNDDYVLIAEIYKKYYGINFAHGFLDIMLNHKRLGLPSFESITRARRKYQEEMPIIYGSNVLVRKARAKMEEEYKEEYGKK